MNIPPRIRRWPLAMAVLVAAMLAAWVFTHIGVRSDLGDLLPTGQTAASRAMLQEVRSGPASSLLLIGMDNAAEDSLAAISDGMAGSLRQSGQFTLVENGRQDFNAGVIDTLFRYRYLLAAAAPGAFLAPALRTDFQGLLAALQSSASPVAEQYGLPDPTGAFRAMMQALLGQSQVRKVQGVWFAPGRAREPGRALMLAQTAASGLDFAAEGKALEEVHRAFEGARAALPSGRGARLQVSGPAVFAYDAAAAIKGDVRLLSTVSSLLVAGLLFWRFRSLWVVAVIAVPLLIGAAAGALAVQMAFGFVHGITLGFGMTMLGVTVDYPVLLIGHRKQNEAASGTLLRIGHAFNLAVLSAALGLTGMVFAGFPGLSQLGVFSVAGILAAAGVTRFVLPRLIVAAGLSPVSAGDPALLVRIEAWRRWRGPALGGVAAAALYLIVVGGPVWDPDLAHLSPVPPAALALDAALRADLGAPETGQMVVVAGPSAEAVLQREEGMKPKLAVLIQGGVIGGADDAASLLPSIRTQRARQAMLPGAAALGEAVALAAQGLGFSAGAFKPFQDAVAASRTLAPLAPGALPSALAGDRLLSARLGALLFQRDGTWFGIIAPRTVRAPTALAAAFAGQGDVTYVDIHAETNGIAASYTSRAWPWLLAGAGAAVLVLAMGLRDRMRLLRVLASIGAALLVTLAGLALTGTKLSLVHLVALQFVAGIGLDYALFFSRTGLDAEERARTLRTLFTCNAMALLTFGLLCLCRTPLLRDIGETVAVGVVAAMLFAFLFAGPRVNTSVDQPV
jgi:predicted exporter